MNAMQKAFEKQGLTSGLNDLRLALSKFINQGGTCAQIRAEVDAIERMPGMDQNIVAQESQRRLVQTRQPVEEGRARSILSQDHAQAVLPSSPLEDVRGHFATVQQDHQEVASPSSSNRGGRDHAQRAQESLSSRVSPVREPKPQRSPIDFGAASLAVKTKLAESIMDRVKTSDGKPWGDVGAHELDGMDRDGALARALKNHLGVLSNRRRFMTIRELVTPEAFEELRRQAHVA